MATFFTADSHFGHARVIEYSKRPFADANDMNEAMIANWNAVVCPRDIVYHLGDFALCDVEKATKIAKRLNGQKHLVFGNHDKVLRKHAPFTSQWIWAKDIAEIKIADQKVILCHYALVTWNGSHRGSWSLHGHSHGSLREDPHALRVDVGVDVWGYNPVSFEALQAYMGRKSFEPVDHHGRKDEESD